MAKKLGVVKDTTPVVNAPVVVETLGVQPNVPVVSVAPPKPEAPLGPVVEPAVNIVAVQQKPVAPVGVVQETVVSVKPPPPPQVNLGIVQEPKILRAAAPPAPPKLGTVTENVVVPQRAVEEPEPTVVSAPSMEEPPVKQTRVHNPFAEQE